MLRLCVNTIFRGITVKKMLYVAFLGLALAGCSPAAPQMTVEVRGAPGEVGEFVAAEKARDAELDVIHSDGTDAAVFAITDPNDGFEISRRAIEARLSVESKSGV